MKVKPLLPNLPKSALTFLEAYLNACGIEDVERYLEADASVLDDPFDYTDMKKGVEMLGEAIREKKKIGVVVDSDGDGQCSSALIINFLKSLGCQTPIYYLHTAKQHGISDLYDNIINDKIELLIVPDAGSNEPERMKLLLETGVNVIICDHHTVSNEMLTFVQGKFSKQIAFINPDKDEKVDNSICGTAVTWQFVKGFCVYHHFLMPDYLDLVAVATVTDVMDLSSLSNRYFIKEGLTETPTNRLLSVLFEKKLRKGANSKGIGWDIGPLFNAVCRGNDMDAKELMFKAMIGEEDIEQAIKAMVRLHGKQTREVKRIQEELNSELDTKHKVNVGFGNASDASYLGLCANKLMSAYNKPTFVLRELNDKTWSGSLRSPVPISSIINKSEIAEAIGHDEAAGIVVEKDSLEDLLNYLDEELDTSIEPEIQVTACIKPKHLSIKLAKFIKKHEKIWGHGVPSPTFYISMPINPSNVFIFEKKTTTIKFVIDGISFIKFSANVAEVEKVKSLIQNGKTANIEMIITPDVNEWEGVESVQGLIDKFELKYPVTFDDCIVDKDFYDLF